MARGKMAPHPLLDQRSRTLEPTQLDYEAGDRLARRQERTIASEVALASSLRETVKMRSGVMLA
jgi:hypothetical protein